MSNIDYICNVCVLMYVIGLLFRIRQIGYYYLITLTHAHGKAKKSIRNVSEPRTISRVIDKIITFSTILPSLDLFLAPMPA